MSASEDRNEERPPRRAVTQEHLTEARQWVSEVGLDADLVRGFAARLREVSDATLADVVKYEDAIQTLQAYVVCWTEALEATLVRANATEVAASDGADKGRELEVLGQAEAGLKAVVDWAWEQMQRHVQDRDRQEARAAVLKELRDEMHESAAPPWCPICIARPVDTVAQPCGHLFCKGCAKRMMTAGGGGGGRRASSGPKPCYTCRRTCKGTMPVYF